MCSDLPTSIASLPNGRPGVKTEIGANENILVQQLKRNFHPIAVVFFFCQMSAPPTNSTDVGFYNGGRAALLSKLRSSMSEVRLRAIFLIETHMESLPSTDDVAKYLCSLVDVCYYFSFATGFGQGILHLKFCYM